MDGSKDPSAGRPKAPRSADRPAPRARKSASRPGRSFQRQMVGVYLMSGALVLMMLLYANGGTLGSWFVPPGGGTGIPESALDGAFRRSVVEPLDDRDHRQMGRQRQKIAELGRRYVGRVPSGSLRDIELIQELLNRRAIESDDVWALQGLGIALGDVLSEQFGVDWVVVNDDYGRSRALQIGDEEDFVFPVTMISKRVAAGHTVYVDALYEKAAGTIRDVRSRRGL